MKKADSMVFAGLVSHGTRHIVFTRTTTDTGGPAVRAAFYTPSPRITPPASRIVNGALEIYVPEAKSSCAVFDIQGKLLSTFTTASAGWTRVTTARGAGIVHMATSRGVQAFKIPLPRQ